MTYRYFQQQHYAICQSRLSLPADQNGVLVHERKASAHNLLKQEKNVRIRKHQIYIDWGRINPDLFGPHLHHFEEAF